MEGKLTEARYDAEVRNFAALARSWMDGTFMAEEGQTPQPVEYTDDALANELHQWLNAPDSFLLTWSNDAEDVARSKSIIDHSKHLARPIDYPFSHDNLSRYDGENPPDPDALFRIQYIAAHVLVRDVMGRLGRTYEMPGDIVLRPLPSPAAAAR